MAILIYYGSPTSNRQESSSLPGPAGTVWSKTFNFTPGVTVYSPDDNGIGPTAISQNDSMVVMGTGGSIGNGSAYAFNQKGAELWTYPLNHYVSSISMSASGSIIAVGGYQIAPGPAGVYENPALYVLNSDGDLMWSKSFSGSFVNAKVSTDGSALGVVTGNELLYVNAKGQVLWSYNAGDQGMIGAWAMSPDGSRIMVSAEHLPRSNATQSVSVSLLMFDSGGDILWNRTSTGTLASPPPEPGGYLPSSDWTHFFGSDASSGTSGNLLLFDENESLVWSRPIHSPVFDLQTVNGSSDVVVQTNWSTLVFTFTGQLVANYTGNVASSVSGAGILSCVPASFWVNLGDSGALFLNGEGSPVSTYPMAVSQVVLSPDGHFATVASNQYDHSTIFFVDLLTGPACGQK